MVVERGCNALAKPVLEESRIDHDLPTYKQLLHIIFKAVQTFYLNAKLLGGFERDQYSNYFNQINYFQALHQQYMHKANSDLTSISVNKPMLL